MAPSKTNLARLVRKARLEDKGWTKEALGRAAGVSAQTIRKLESGIPVSDVSLARIAKALGIRPESLGMKT